MSTHPYGVEPTRSSTPVPATKPGTIEGTSKAKYLVEEMLGEGGMGTVYLARQLVLERPVALKILRPEISRMHNGAERFVREARAAARVRHEHVVDILDFGETANGELFLAMELLEGRDLTTELHLTRPLPWPRIKSIMLQICQAIEAAHAVGVVHRDLKPDNIYLVRRSMPDFVKILDFGLAKMMELDNVGKKLTQNGAIYGTPEYIAPEQARGERTDHRVDVYAAGCVLFEMVTGDVPFTADTLSGIIYKHITDPPPHLRDCGDRDDVPLGLDGVIQKALAKDRDERYSSMHELAQAIYALEDSGPVAYPTEVESSVQRRFTITALISTLILSIGLMLYMALSRTSKLDSDTPVAVPPDAGASTDAMKASAAPDAMIKPDASPAPSPPLPSAPVDNPVKAVQRAAIRKAVHKVAHKSVTSIETARTPTVQPRSRLKNPFGDHP
jgi:serine/threonine protein kinase